MKQARTLAELKKQRNKLALNWHPDKNKQKISKTRFVEINDKFETLRAFSIIGVILAGFATIALAGHYHMNLPLVAKTAARIMAWICVLSYVIISILMLDTATNSSDLVAAFYLAIVNIIISIIAAITTNKAAPFGGSNQTAVVPQVIS